MKLIMENWRRYQQDVALSEAKTPWEEDEDAVLARLFPDEAKEKAKAAVDAKAREKGLSRRRFLGALMKAGTGAALAATGLGGVVAVDRELQSRKRVQAQRDYLAANPDATPREVATATGAVGGDPPDDSGLSIWDWAANPFESSKKYGEERSKQLLADHFGGLIQEYEKKLAAWIRKAGDAVVDLVPSVDYPGPWDKPGSIKEAFREAIDRKADEGAKCFMDLIRPEFVEILYKNPPPSPKQTT